jgi:hypothetical protein
MDDHHPTTGATAPTSPSEPLFSLRRGLVGAAKGAAVVLLVACVVFGGAVLAAARTKPGTVLTDLRIAWPPLVAIASVIGGCAGFAARAPRGNYGFGTTLAIVFFGSLGTYSCATMSGSVETSFRALDPVNGKAAVLLVAASPPFFIAIFLTLVRTHPEQLAEKDGKP